MSISIEAIVGILCLFVGLPPSLLIMWKCLKSRSYDPRALESLMSDGRDQVSTGIIMPIIRWLIFLKQHIRRFPDTSFTIIRRQKSCLTDLEIWVERGPSRRRLVDSVTGEFTLVKQYMPFPLHLLTLLQTIPTT